MKKVILLLSILIISIASLGQNDRYWSGGSPTSDLIDQGANWHGGVNPSSGDNLYFDNTINRHWARSNYGSGSFFNFFITYNGAGGIKLYGDNTYANKFENFSDANLLELSPDNAIPGNREIGNRINNDLEINPVGTGGILVSCDKISMDNLNGARNLKVYGTNTLTINGSIYEKNGAGATLQIKQAATVELKGNSTFTGTTTIDAGLLKLNAAGGALNSGNAVHINGGALIVMQNQTIGNLTLSSGILVIDAGVTLTITGTYSATGGTINNKGTIKLSGGSVNFPGVGVTVNNGLNTFMDNLEIASTGTVTLNSGFTIGGTLTLTSGTLHFGSSVMSFTGNIVRTAGNINATTGGIDIYNSSNVSIPASTFVSNSIGAMSIVPGVPITVNFNDDISISSLFLNSNGTLVIGSYTLSLPTNSTLSGMLTGSPASNLIIGGGVGTLNFTAGGRSLNNLTLNAGGSATLGSALDVYGNINVLNTAAGALNLAGFNLTLKSDVNNTATIDKLNATGSNLIGASNVTVERWIKRRGTPVPTGDPNGGRAYRVLGSTVTTALSIKENWQENLMNTAVGTNLVPVAPYENFGVQITGTTGNGGGFDVTQNNQPSLYTFTPGSDINSTTGFPAVTSTSGILDAKTGYFLYIRGDRNTSMQVPYNPLGGMATSSTTLRATGQVQQGNVDYTISNVDGHYTLITNPYPAPLDWNLVSGGNSMISNSYTFWNSNNSTEGGFVTVPVNGTNRYIQPGEGFFVLSNGTGNIVTITEAMKAVGNNDNTIFRQNTTYESFAVELKFTEANGYKHNADELQVRYGNYSAAIDADDADELSNWYENIAISRSNTRLALESRPVIVSKDTIPLYMNGMRQTNYEWVFTPSMFTNIGLKAELIDNFLNTRTLLSVIDSVVVPFNVTANPASSAANRFMVVFGSFGPLAIDVLTIKAQAKNNSVQVDWTAKTEQDMDRYELERSFNGTSFSNIKTTAAMGNSQVAVNYSWLDVNPQVGNNYYRIKAIDKAGLVKYTNIVQVVFGKTNTTITVSPNPVTGNFVNLKLSDLPKGSYTVQLFNSMGQQVLVSRFNHVGGSVNQPVNLPGDIAGGTYQLILSDGETRSRTTIIKN